MPSINVLANWLLRLPLLWGGLVSLAFYAGIQSGWVSSEILTRYFASHPVEVVATLLFFVGAASLGLRLTSLLGHLGAAKLDPLGPLQSGGQPTSDVPLLLAKLDNLSAPLRRTPLVRRLRLALDYVQDTGSADALEGQLVRLEEADRDRSAEGYALPRLIRATLPIIGMLGTVIGITLAIGQLSPDQLEESLTEVMGALSIAFDTTAQAMSLMLVLWFAIFGVERVEERLLDEVDKAASRQLIGRFHQYGSQTDPNVAAIRLMGEQVISAVDELSDRQASTWQTAINETHERWRTATSAAGEILTTTLASGLRDGLRDHATGLTEGIELQLAGLTNRLNDQQQGVADAIRDQLTALHELQQDHTSQMHATQAEHAARMQQTTEEQTSRIVAGADGVLGNLREGLERMAELLVEALQRHGETLTLAENELATENRRHLGEVEAALGEAMVVAADRQEKLVRQSESVLREMQQALVSAAGATIDHQQELVRQGDVLLKVVDATGQVQQLEDTLNRNLSTLGRAHNFEETLMSLSAAIQLLSARMSRESDTTTAAISTKQAA